MKSDPEDLRFDAAFTERIGGILPRVEEADYERVDPPADLWGRIAGSVASEPATSLGDLHGHPKEPPSRDVPVSTVIEYSIDADDHVIDVGACWTEFARDNAAGELAAIAPDRTLWSYFDSVEIREMWQLLVEHVRSSQTGVQVPLRCDAPHARRWIEMTVTPEPGGRVHFRSVVVFEEFRPTVTLLDPRAERDDSSEPVPVCSWCGRGQQGSEWLEIEDLVRSARLLERESIAPISHGICATCREEMSAELLASGGTGEATT